MPFTADQLTSGATYALNTYQKKEPVDQINVKHVILDWLVQHKEPTSFGNGYVKLPLYYANGSNYQNYFGADQVTYNERDPAKWAEFAYFNHHDGFWFDEDRLAAAGIILTDDRNAVASDSEKLQLINLLKQSYRGLKDGIQENLAFELIRDGSQSTKACPGIEHIIDPTPAVGTVGGLNSATYTWWQNNANTGITAADIVAEMEQTWMDCMKRGGMTPDFIVCGRSAYETYRTYSIAAVDRQIAVGGKGGTQLDPSITGLNFHGVPVVWDPTLDELDTLLGTSTRTKTMYFLNSKALKLRPMAGHWMVNRKPERLPDRYVHYFGQTSKYGLTTDKRNCMAVITIA
jgi:hypothetical protein